MKRPLVLIAFLLAGCFCSAESHVRQLAELTSSDGAAFDEFGSSAAIAGNTAVVGAPRQVVGGPGAAYVFARTGTTWIQIAQLAGSGSQEEFAFSVAISGDTIVVGAPYSADGFLQQGAVYVFVKPAGGWRDMAPTARLTIPAGMFAANLGSSVGLSTDGTTVVAGAPGVASAYVFVQPAGGWQDTDVPTATLFSASISGLGNTVAMSGNTVVAGALNGFAACVFVEPESGWQDAQPTAVLTSSDGFSGDAFGISVAISGNTVAVGAPFQPSVGPGTVYVFVKPSGGWRDMTQTAELTLPVRSETALGSALAIVGNLIAAGAPLDVIGNTRQGAVFGYLKPPGGWKNTKMPNLAVTSSDGATKDTFGASLALSSTIGIIGAPQHAVNGQTFQGAAYVFGQK
ncbi:MAG: hypothetical protein ACLPOO_08535 [Terriglobales bacterium]